MERGKIKATAIVGALLWMCAVVLISRGGTADVGVFV
jgi:hypothetical protein